jgi:hypothetical protein
MRCSLTGISGLHVYDAAGNVIETDEHKGDFKQP